MRMFRSLYRRFGVVFRTVWAKFWMRYSGSGMLGRTSTRLASLFIGPFRSRYPLARLYPHGYVSPTAILSHRRMSRGQHVFIGDRVIVYGRGAEALVRIGDDVHINQDCVLETAEGGGISIGDGSRIQSRCQLSAYKGDIVVGRHVQIAPNCAFYPYNHEARLGELIKHQRLKSRGPIVVQDDVWLGYGVIVLDGTTIGTGAIVGAGSVVTSSIPDNAIAVGNPARVIGYRE